MKAFKVVLLLLLTAFSVQGQISDPVKWSASSSKIGDKEYEITVTATIEEHWHIYSQFLEGDDGPIASEIDFKATGLELLGKTTEPKEITGFDKTFEMNITYHEGKVDFKQRVKVGDNFKDPVSITAFSMACNDERCLPPEEKELFINLNNKQTEKIEWKVGSEKISDKEYNITFKASLLDNWHIYSQKPQGDDGPIATTITIKNSNVELIGKVIEPVGISKYEKALKQNVTYFENEVTFKQKIKVGNDFKGVLDASVLFMLCDDKMCLPPETVDFKINIRNSTSSGIVKNNMTISNRDKQLSEQLRLDIKSTPDFEISQTTKKSLWNLFLLGFIGGFIALLTPCVFPMIPLTVSFFSHSSGGSRAGVFKALMYGFFIVVTYILVSVPFHLLDSVNPDILNNVSTNTWLNITFFIIFIIFAISFFGYFEITLPSKWSNAMDSKATQLGGGLGVFFMALTLVLVSFSCTGPILGSLLGGSLTNDGGAIQLTYGLAGFGLALALPFAFFALFPNLLKKLPKSGGWMTTVKVILGFVEVALALKFFSNADLVEHWGILKREVFVGLWILIALGLAGYLFGLYRFPHDSPNQKISGTRKVLAIIALVFAGYLAPGVLQTKEANLKMLSGFPPPMQYSIYSEQEAHFKAHSFTSFKEGLKEAKKVGKPILIDFTGWACVNCRKMEENVWSDSKIKQILDNEVVLVSLYVDDRKALPEQEQFLFKYKGTSNTKKIKTVGDKWATFQTINFKNNSQPYYVMLDADLNLLQQPVGNTPNVEVYYNWLKTGLINFKK